MSASRERRRSRRRQSADGSRITIGLFEDGVPQSEIDAELVDYSDWGLRVNTAEPVPVGSLVSVGGTESNKKVLGGKKRSSHVAHCGSNGENGFRLGLVFQESGYPLYSSCPDGGTIALIYQLLVGRQMPIGCLGAVCFTANLWLKRQNHPESPAKSTGTNAGSRPDMSARITRVKWITRFQEFSAEGGWTGKQETRDTGVDLYEVLQVSPNADFEMIQRVYRLLAQRYHPDNRESGNEEVFKRVLQAYRVLADPAERASYDAGYRAQQRKRWKVFDKPGAAEGVDAERRKRQGVISLLYTKKMREPRKAGLTLREIEDLLDIPKEHMEFCLWYLGENGLVARGDNARYEITVEGVNWAERSGEWGSRKQRLLESPEADPPRANGERPEGHSEVPDQWVGQAS